MTVCRCLVMTRPLEPVTCDLLVAGAFKHWEGMTLSGRPSVVNGHFSQLAQWLFCDHLFNPYLRLVDRNSFAIPSTLTCRALISYSGAHLQFIILFSLCTVDLWIFLDLRTMPCILKYSLLTQTPWNQIIPVGVGDRHFTLISFCLC